MRNDYHERLENRREAFERLADKAERTGKAALETAHDMASVIPFGQPILVGHHSEKRDRRYRKRIDDKFRKGFESLEKAKHYAIKAQTVGGGGISADDPEALAKVREQLAEREEHQTEMKADNAKLRKAKISPDDPQAVEKLRAVGLSDRTLHELVSLLKYTPYQVRPHFKLPGYALSNNNAQIKRLRDRIKVLERMAPEDAPDETVAVHPGGPNLGKIESRPEIGRVAITFPGPPAAEIRAELKRNGFRWSRREGAWLRHLHTSGGVVTYLVQRWGWVRPDAAIEEEGGAA